MAGFEHLPIGRDPFSLTYEAVKALRKMEQARDQKRAARLYDAQASQSFAVPNERTSAR
jgi:hypothetical protein